MKPAQTHSALAEEQASLWAARLDGSVLSPSDRSALETWLTADPAHRVLLSSYCQFSADLEQQLPLLAGIRDELAESSTTAKNTRLLSWLRRPILAGATLTAAAVAMVILWQGRPQNHFQSITAPVAQRQQVTLPDGTRVELNAGTTLTVELRPEARQVRFAGGEAFFQVSPDPARPFLVETPAGSVRVTGTEFNVRAESLASLEVTVLEGSVQVRTGDDATPRSLRTGDQLVREAQQVKVATLSAGQVGDALAWRQGRIVFDATPLREVLGRFARYHGRNLTASDAAAHQRVGGNYSLDDLDGFLGALEEALPVTVTRRSDGTIQVEARPGL